MSFVPQFWITNRIAAALTDIERAGGFLNAATLSDAWTHAMRCTGFLMEAHHTTHIVGTHLTIDEAAELLAGASAPALIPKTRVSCSTTGMHSNSAASI
ncbi:MAG: hypothetical protein OXG43_06425 [Chloroflexi bacterium]|nr:hypothetical protein [Chloroflexota bacterium]